MIWRATAPADGPDPKTPSADSAAATLPPAPSSPSAALSSPLPAPGGASGVPRLALPYGVSVEGMDLDGGRLALRLRLMASGAEEIWIIDLETGEITGRLALVRESPI